MQSFHNYALRSLPTGHRFLTTLNILNVGIGFVLFGGDGSQRTMIAAYQLADHWYQSALSSQLLYERAVVDTACIGFCGVGVDTHWRRHDDEGDDGDGAWPRRDIWCVVNLSDGTYKYAQAYIISTHMILMAGSVLHRNADAKHTLTIWI